MKKLIALVVVGFAIKFFLDSRHGYRLKQQVRSKIKKAEDFINDKLEKATDKIEETASRVDRLMTDNS